MSTCLTFYQLHYFLTLHFYIYYLHNTTRLSFLKSLITIVDTSLHWFMPLKHQSSGSFNSSSSSHYFSRIFACYTDLRKLVGKRSLKPHKAVLFLSLQFNQNRHKSNTNPQLNFLQAKYWTKKKKSKIVANIYDNKLISSQHFAFASLLIWSARSDSYKSVLLKSWYTI